MEIFIIKPIVNKDGAWECESKPIVYSIRLSVKNTDGLLKEYELECTTIWTNERLQGWGAWMEDKKMVDLTI